MQTTATTLRPHVRVSQICNRVRTFLSEEIEYSLELLLVNSKILNRLLSLPRVVFLVNSFYLAMRDGVHPKCLLSGASAGNTNTAQPAQPTGFTGFGQQQQQQQQQQPAAQGTGLFGATTTAQPPATGGLFGGFGNQAKPAGGLFGATGTPATTNPPAAGGLFGSTTTQPQQAGAATGGLFGNTNQPAATQTAPGWLFE